MSPPANLAAAFAAVARAQPETVALITGTRRVTYAELSAQARQIARGLAARGVRPGDRVGVELARSVDLVATMLAVFRLGAILVPVEAAWRAAVTVAHRVETVEGLDGPEDVAPEVAADALALALYTSGSTGAPRAVLLDHRAVLARLSGLAHALPYAADDVACHRTPPTFIDAYAEIFGPLLAGVPAVILPDPLALSDLAAALGTHAVTRLLLVPSLLGLLLDACPTLPPTLRLIATSGEPLTEALATRVFAASGAQLVNIYGCTEVAGDATLATIGPGEAITIGGPLAGVTLRIVDEELQVAGPILARGYADDPVRTAARFIQEDGTAWFRTGDRARRLADGRYVLAGRLDDQVKIHGVRVELGEVEAALLARPGVRAAGAALHAGRIVAAVVGERLDLAALQAALRLALRPAAVPSALALLATLPLTPHGKRDRAALAAAVLATASTTALVPASTEPRALRIAAWFSELAGAPAGVDDELASLGGDSLARLGLLVRLERAGWHLAHADLPTPLTPARLAAVLGEPVASVTAPDANTPFRVTDFQRVMVLEALANRGTPMWVDQLAYTIHAPLAPERFAAAWRAEIAAQPALRTRFLVDHDVQQIADPTVAFELAHVPLAALALDAYRLRVKAEEWARLSRTFDLATAPLFDVCLLTGADRCDLIFTYHHAILDGESARRVLRAVLARAAGDLVLAAPAESLRAGGERPVPSAPTTALRARLAGHVGTPPRPPPRATGAGDLAWRVFHRLVAIRTWLAARRVRRHRARLPLTHVPAVYAGGDLTSQPLPRALEAALAMWARGHRTTVVTAWALAFALHLARERSTLDVVFGVVVSGRDGRSAETVGMLANCLPLRIQLAPAATLASTVAAVTAALAELDAAGRAPMLDLGLDPRLFLDTLLTVWQFPRASAPSLPVRSGRGLTMTAPHTALVVSPTELAVGAAAFHRADRVRREILALVDAILAAAPDLAMQRLLDASAHEGGLGVAQPDL